MFEKGEDIESSESGNEDVQTLKPKHERDVTL